MKYLKIETINDPMEIPPPEYIEPVPQPTRVDVYCLMVDFMALKVSYKTKQKLNILKERIMAGFQSPVTLSMELFEINLFPFEYKHYVSMYLTLKGGM